MNLPVEVIEAARTGRLLLLVGSRASEEAAMEADTPWPGPRELARRLGAKGTLREALGALEKKEGRGAVLKLVRDARHLDCPPGRFHHALVRRFDRAWTTSPDDLIERAAAEAGKAPLVSLHPAPYADAPEGGFTLVKLRGSLDAPESLVLTETDQAGKALLLRRDDIRKALRSNVLLMVGFRPDDEEFERTFEELLEAWGGEIPRVHLAVAQGKISDYHWQKWVWRGLLLFIADPSEVLEELERHLAS